MVDSTIHRSIQTSIASQQGHCEPGLACSSSASEDWKLAGDGAGMSSHPRDPQADARTVKGLSSACAGGAGLGGAGESAGEVVPPASRTTGEEIIRHEQKPKRKRAGVASCHSRVANVAGGAAVTESSGVIADAAVGAFQTMRIFRQGYAPSACDTSGHEKKCWFFQHRPRLTAFMCNPASTHILGTTRGASASQLAPTAG